MKEARLIFAGVAGALLTCASADADGVTKAPVRPVHTYSIIAYDPDSGELGAAVQSHWFKVNDVIWVEPGVGAVATQSFTDTTYGSLGLEMMKQGKTAHQALEGLLAVDELRGRRQVAMIDLLGNVASHTGEGCIEHAGHASGENFSVQANLMEKPSVWAAMAKAFEGTKGDLAERMMAALEAAQREGGDIRGSQSAAMIVVQARPSEGSGSATLIDVRVDDSKRPLEELRRLVDMSRAYRLMETGDELVAAGKFDLAKKHYDRASKLAPDNLEIRFWWAVALASSGRVKQSLRVFKEIFSKDGSWRELVPRLRKSGLFPDDERILEQVMSL